MSTRACVARALCAVLAAGVASAPSRALALHPEPRGGLDLGRLSRGDLRTWRAIEQVVATSDAAGVPRSPTLRRLWEWARTSPHVIHVEMVPPSKLAAGLVGVFRVEALDPAGRSHVAVIRLCPTNIQRAKVSRGPNSIESFVRFEGLTEAERHAEVLAHELAHAQYVLESPERLAEVEAAQRDLDEFVTRAGRRTGPPHHEVGRWCRKSLDVLAASEAHAESVEAVVREDLAGTRIANR